MPNTLHASASGAAAGAGGARREFSDSVPVGARRAHRIMLLWTDTGVDEFLKAVLKKKIAR
jgi:hypothetical protein